MATSVSLQFHHTVFNPIDRGDGRIWLRSTEIGEALGYANGHKAINNLYNANVLEFNDKMTGVLETRTPSGRQEVRVFSLRGAYLLAMKATTPRAAEFRRWALDVLESAIPGAAQSAPTQNFERLLSHLQSELLIARPDWQALQRYHAAGLTPTEMGKLIGKSAGAVRHLLLRMHAAGLIDYRPSRLFAAAGHKGKQVQQSRQLSLGV